MLLYALIASILATSFDIFGLSTLLDQKYIFGVYTIIAIIVSIPLIFLWNLIREIIFKNQLNLQMVIVDDMKFDTNNPSFAGMTNYVGLRIENEDFEITDCRVTLEHIDNGSESLIAAQSIGLFRLGALCWKNDYGRKDCMISIPPKSKEEIVYIAQISSGVKKINWRAINKPVKPTMEFNFSYCKNDGMNTAFGFYYIVVRINGKINDKEIRPKYFNGYVYSEPLFRDDDTPFSFHLYLGEGDPMKDDRIPKEKIPLKDTEGKETLTKDGFFKMLDKIILTTKKPKSPAKGKRKTSE